MSYSIFQLPKATLFSSGVLQPGWTVEFFLTGTTTPTPVYTTSALDVEHDDPVEADAAGILPVVYLDSSIAYKASVYNTAGALAYTVDPVNDGGLSQADIGELLYPRTAAEIAAGVTPTNYAYPPGDARRYGADPAASAATNVAAFNAAVTANRRAWIDFPGTYAINDQIIVPSNTWFTIGADVTIQNTRGSAWLEGMIQIDGVENVRIDGAGIIDGNKAAHGTDRLNCIEIFDSQKVWIDGSLQLINAPGLDASGANQGDGLYIGGTGLTDGVCIGPITCDGNVRQGCSLVRGSNVTFMGTRFINTTGDNPGGGLDMEVDSIGETLENIRVIGCEFDGNNSSLIMIGATGVTVSGCTLKNGRGGNGLASELQIVYCNDVSVDRSNLIFSAPTSASITMYVEETDDALIAPVVHGSRNANELHLLRVSANCNRITISPKVYSHANGVTISPADPAVGEDINVVGGEYYDCGDGATTGAVISIGSGTGINRVNVLRNTIHAGTGITPPYGILFSGSLPSANLATCREGGNIISGTFDTSALGNAPLKGSITWNPGDLADAAGETSSSIAVIGAADGDGVIVYPPYSTQGLLVTGYVTGADAVSIRIQNETGGNVNLASGVWWVEAVKRQA